LKAVTAIRSAGGQAAGLAGSVTAADFPQKLVDATVESFGAIDILVNNAGYAWDNVIQKMSDEQFQAMLDIHLVAPFACCAPPRAGFAKPRSGRSPKANASCGRW
jgi:3-oxoacyl-[acyl-carrier protein] reductase